MAWELTKMCWLARGLDKVEKAVLGRICDRASYDSSKPNYLICYASQKRIAWETNYNIRSVIRAVRGLRARGLIEVNRIKSLNNPYPNNIYTIRLKNLELHARQGEQELNRLKDKTDNRVKRKNEQFSLRQIETVDESWNDLMDSII